MEIWFICMHKNTQKKRWNLAFTIKSNEVCIETQVSELLSNNIRNFINSLSTK